MMNLYSKDIIRMIDSFVTHRLFMRIRNIGTSVSMMDYILTVKVKIVLKVERFFSTLDVMGIG